MCGINKCQTVPYSQNAIGPWDVSRSLWCHKFVCRNILINSRKIFVPTRVRESKLWPVLKLLLTDNITEGQVTKMAASSQFPIRSASIHSRKVLIARKVLSLESKLQPFFQQMPLYLYSYTYLHIFPLIIRSLIFQAREWSQLTALMIKLHVGPTFTYITSELLTSNIWAIFTYLAKYFFWMWWLLADILLKESCHAKLG